MQITSTLPLLSRISSAKEADISACSPAVDGALQAAKAPEISEGSRQRCCKACRSKSGIPSIATSTKAGVVRCSDMHVGRGKINHRWTQNKKLSGR